MGLSQRWLTLEHCLDIDITDPAIGPQTQGLMHRGQNGRQHRVMHPALKQRDLGSNPTCPPPTSSGALHKLFKFMMATYLQLLNQGKCFWIQSGHEMMYEMHLAQSPAPGGYPRVTLSKHSPVPTTKAGQHLPSEHLSCIGSCYKGSKVTRGYSGRSKPRTGSDLLVWPPS